TRGGDLVTIAPLARGFALADALLLLGAAARRVLRRGATSLHFDRATTSTVRLLRRGDCCDEATPRYFDGATKRSTRRERSERVRDSSERARWAASSKLSSWCSGTSCQKLGPSGMRS